MVSERHNELRQLLQGLAESLDISDAQYEAAVKHYEAVGDWLSKDDSPIVVHDPQIYPQGSFRHGTMIKPFNDADKYDIDLVCELKALKKENVTQKQLKDMVGDRLKANERYRKMLEEGKRCWTLQYADSARFHMDILPAIPDDEINGIAREIGANLAQSAILITDRELYNWQRSNPVGYAEWFKERMRVQFDAKRMLLAKSLQASVEDVPEYKVKTPLQRSIQILKRHRDIMFKDDQDGGPISIIITTLAARAYDNEADLLDALQNIVNKMPGLIGRVEQGNALVANPVNPLENFADKWKRHPELKTKFYEWIQQVRVDLEAALRAGNLTDMIESLKPRFGDRIANEALEKAMSTSSKAKSLVPSAPRKLTRFNAPHRQPPLWPVRQSHSVTVSGQVKSNGDWNGFSSDSTPLPKHLDLLFRANTDVQRPFNVFWQVVNTGFEAERANGLRGEIVPSKTAGVGGLTQKESTLYTGKHWIECFIVKNDVCVARSSEFVVNIQ